MTSNQDYAGSIEDWRAERLARLKAEDGWLNIIGRWWLEPGSVTVGSSQDNDIVLPVGPAHLGQLTQTSAGEVSFVPAAGGAPTRLTLDKKPVRFVVGRLLMEVTTLAGQNALRIRDRESSAPANFAGIDYFPIDPAWRFVADWLTLEQPVVTTVDTMIGIPTEVTITHKAAFTRDGVRYELLPTHGTPEAPQFVIRDLTSGKETYPASRFLFGEDIGPDTIVLDFNKAINPPCAFTDHAVCPLPPPQNVLPVRIAAGELALKS
ncbi:DUF1684 domain-containing protein [Mesorhizobium sp. BAC0120]|uniref:DUF1684 domain-containing protein n=1 Tax=Mesorhizobium sp. BAC0120 TaxID=3090670 RepID=UPI00298D5575|nr:DUF1684 domain-containing protein [Mesorhizobium sp. BAC0120]MDW6024335.1 DUF1684 domain-containing protein [Mesorhizobium sp. BAC0120]